MPTPQQSKSWYQKNLEVSRKKARERKAAERDLDPIVYKNKCKEINERTSLKAIIEIDQLLGITCVCCGTTENLQIDHKYGDKRIRSSRGSGPKALRAQIRKSPKDFQKLCYNCNRWKNNGPLCPCKWWDQIAPGWRSTMEKKEQSDFDKVGDFHQKFGLDNATHTPPAPQLLPQDVRDFRLRFLLEELAELAQGYGLRLDYHLEPIGEKPHQDLPQVADALVDLVYVALGTAHLHRLPWADLFAEVQRANMSKERVTAANDPRSTRGHALDVVKPVGFRPPDIKGVLSQHGFGPKMASVKHHV